VQNLIKISAAAALGLGLAQPALADTAETKGGITIKTDDGRFQAVLGGRIHYDLNLVDGDDAGVSGADLSDVFFRRARLTLSGKAYGWEYKFEQDFSGGAPTERDLYIATTLGPGKLLLGQFKPFRGMEEMTSSNEITFMERPYVQANFPSEQFSMGAGYTGGSDAFTYALGLQNRKVEAAGNNSNEAMVGSARFTFAPINSDGTVVHVGLSGSVDNLNRNGAGVQQTDNVTVQYAGRNVGSLNLSSAFIEGTFLGLEAAAAVGPFYVQGELMQGDLDLSAGGSEDVMAYYIQASFHLTGEAKPYKGGVFKSVKPNSPSGAVELKARIEAAENKDVTDNEVSAMTLGVNWYVNPNVRFMLDYITAEAKAGTSVGADEPNVISARAQFTF
jgi:phosphate-selective porin OprO/OprP